MTLASHLEAISAELKAAELPSTTNVDISPGRFDASEIKRRGFRCPALRVTFLGAPRTQPLPDRTRKFNCAFAIFILTDGSERTITGLDLIETVANVIEVNRFSAHSVGFPEDVRIESLYTGEIDNKGISISAVSWTQAMRIGTSIAQAGPLPGAEPVGANADIGQTFDITELPDGV